MLLALVIELLYCLRYGEDPLKHCQSEPMPLTTSRVKLTNPLLPVAVVYVLQVFACICVLYYTDSDSC